MRAHRLFTGDEEADKRGRFRELPRRRPAARASSPDGQGCLPRKQGIRVHRVTEPDGGARNARERRTARIIHQQGGRPLHRRNTELGGNHARYVSPYEAVHDWRRHLWRAAEIPGQARGCNQANGQALQGQEGHSTVAVLPLSAVRYPYWLIGPLDTARTIGNEKTPGFLEPP